MDFIHIRSKILQPLKGLYEREKILSGFIKIMVLNKFRI